MSIHSFRRCYIVEQVVEEVVDINRNAEPHGFCWGIAGYGKIAVAHTEGIMDQRHRLTGFSARKSKIRSGDARDLICNLGPRGKLFDTSEMFVTDDWRQLLKNGHVDGLIISTHTPSHAEIAIAAAEEGVPCLIEKPIAMDSAEGERILDAFSCSSIRIAVNQELACFPPYFFLFELLKTINLQEVHILEMRRSLSWDSLTEEPAIAKETGFVRDLSIHDLNFLLQRFPDLSVIMKNGEDWAFERVQQCIYFAHSAELTTQQEITVEVGLSRHYSGFAHSWNLEFINGSAYWFDGKDVWSDLDPKAAPVKVNPAAMSTGQVFGRVLGMAADYFKGVTPDCSFLSAPLATQTLRLYEPK